MPLLSYNPSPIPSPSLDFTSSSTSYNSGTGLISLYWFGNGSSYYKVFRRDGKAYMQNVGDSGPTNRYGNIDFNQEYQTTNNFILFDIGANSGTKFNFFVFGYDANGNRSSLPNSQFYLKSDGSTITLSESPVYIYKTNEPNSGWSDFINNSFPASTSTFVNNYENPPVIVSLDWNNSIDVNGQMDFPQIPAILNTTSDPINTINIPA